jgi:hypothetical protein
MLVHKNLLQQEHLVAGTNKADGPTRQAGQQGRWANMAGGPTWQVGQQGRWANKAGGPTRQVGQQGRWAGSTEVPTLTANIFVAATNRTNIDKKAVLSGNGLDHFWIFAPMKHSLP